MEWADVRQQRAAAIERMQSSLDGVVKEEGSRVVTALALILGFVAAIGHQTVKVTLSAAYYLLKHLSMLVVSPLIHLYCLVDITIMFAWFSMQAYKRMHEDPK